jgi:hypothetical protein
MLLKDKYSMSLSIGYIPNYMERSTAFWEADGHSICVMIYILYYIDYITFNLFLFIWVRGTFCVIIIICYKLFSFFQWLRNSPPFMELKLQPATGPYPELDKSSPYFLH